MASDGIDSDTISTLLIDNAAEILHQKRRENVLQFRQDLDDIIDKYSHNFDEVGDEIDIMTGEVIVDRGHLRRMQTELDTGAEQAASATELPSVLASVERDDTMDAAENGWETDDSVDELSAEFFTSGARRLGRARAHSNKENVRPALGEVALSHEAQTNSASPETQEVTSSGLADAQALNLSSQTISAVQSFLAMAKQLEPLLQAAVQPRIAPVQLQITMSHGNNGFDPNHRPSKRQRLGHMPSIESEYTKQFADIVREPHSASCTFPAEYHLSGSELGERRRRENNHTDGSIWDPSHSDRANYPAKRLWTATHPAKPRQRHNQGLSHVSALRHEVLRAEDASEDIPSESDNTSSAASNDLQQGDAMLRNESAFRYARQAMKSIQAVRSRVRGDHKIGRPAASFTDDEDIMLIRLLRDGRGWAEITSHFPGRSMYQVWYHHRTQLWPYYSDLAQLDSEAGETTEQDLSDTELSVRPVAIPTVQECPTSVPVARVFREPQASRSFSSPTSKSTVLSRKKARKVPQVVDLDTTLRNDSLTASHYTKAETSDSDDDLVLNKLQPAVHVVVKQSRYVPKPSPKNSEPVPDLQRHDIELVEDHRERTPSPPVVVAAFDTSSNASPVLLPQVSVVSSSATKDRAAIVSSPPKRPTPAKRQSMNKPRPYTEKPRATPTTKASKTPSKGLSSHKSSVSSKSSKLKARSQSRISQFLLGDADDGEVTEDEDIILISSSPSKFQLPRRGIIKVE